jgi:hypothetical protein
MHSTYLDWKNKHYAELRALIGQRNIIALNSSETDLKQIISLNKELTTTTPIVENSEQETGEAIELGYCCLKIFYFILLNFDFLIFYYNFILQGFAILLFYFETCL